MPYDDREPTPNLEGEVFSYRPPTGGDGARN